MKTTTANRPDGGPPVADGVVVLGAGLAGALTAALLTAEGAPVTVVPEPNPSTLPSGPITPETTGLLRLLATRHGAPEIGALASAAGYGAAGCPDATPQRAIGFVYHGAARQHPRQTNTFVPPRILDAPPYLRQDDAAALLLRAAVGRGADVVAAGAVRHVDESSGLVRLDDGRELRGAVAVDTCGPLASFAAGGAAPTDADVRDRVAVARFHAMPPYERVPAATLHDSPVPWSATALHHVTPDAVVVVSPAPADGGESVVSLRWSGDEDAAERFAGVLACAPDVAAAFDGAEQTSAWTEVRRPLDAQVPAAGSAYVALPEATGATDAFDRELPGLLLAASALAARLGGRDAASRAPVDAAALADAVAPVAAARSADACWRAALRTAAADYATWNAAFRVWAVGQIHGTVWAEDVRRRAAWDELATPPHPGSPIPESADYARLVDHLAGRLAAARSGALSAEAAALAVFADLATAPAVPPTFGLADPDRRHYVPTPPRMLRALRWARTSHAEAAVARRIAPTLRSLARERIATRIGSAH